jgi:hypothetical protein
MIKINTLIRAALLCILFASNAWAYIDPGSGMLLWQGIIAAVGAVLIFIKNPVQIIKSWIKRMRDK